MKKQFFNWNIVFRQILKWWNCVVLACSFTVHYNWIHVKETQETFLLRFVSKVPNSFYLCGDERKA